MPRFHGKQIMLREYLEDDYSGMRCWGNNRDTTRWLSTRYWMQQTDTDTADQLHRRMQSSHNEYAFVIADEDTGDYLGETELFDVDWRLRSAKAAIVIGLSGDRNRGYGREALSLLTDFAFLTLGLERVQIEAAAENAQALHCYRSVGFMEEGVMRNAYYADGSFRDVVLLGMIRSDYDALH